MFYVYILKSKSCGRYYIGHTEDVDKRLERHNNGLVTSTKHYIPWEIIHIENFQARTEAHKREVQIKSYKGGNAFKKLIDSI